MQYFVILIFNIAKEKKYENNLKNNIIKQNRRLLRHQEKKEETKSFHQLHFLKLLTVSANFLE